MDNITDALIRIKNGYQVGKAAVSLRYSKLVLRLMKLLKEQGYIEDVKEGKGQIEVTLKYNLRKPALSEVQRISKPSLRVYKGVAELPSVLNGLGIAIISTPKGLMTDKQARKQKMGGEVLAFVW